MAITIVEIGGRKWAAGFTWRIYNERPTNQSIQDEGQTLEADWVAIRRGPEAIQVGFGAKPDGVSSTRGICSLAAAAAEQQEQPWLGIYQITEDLWWFLAVRDGHAVLPDGDLVGTKAEVEAARDRKAGFLNDWNYVAGDANDLAVLVAAAGRKRTRVEALNAPPRWLAPALAGLAAVVILGAGAALWSHLEARWAEQARQEQLARDAAARARQAAVRQASILETMPAPAGWLAACRDTVSRLPLSVGGWQLGPYDCSGNAVHVAWRRGPGATPAAAPPGDIESGGGAIKELISLPGSPVGQNNAVPLQEAEARLYSLLLPIGARVAVTKAAAGQNLPGSPTVHLMPRETFQAELPIAPFSVRWDTIPGLVLESASSTGNGAWILKGSLYGR
ncbi:MAG: type 4b pilus protein PilO2 [Acetobacteraceae bacterium]|nr:type 4b pilus protein PilO2 [Acetobacteraceae bacterium]